MSPLSPDSVPGIRKRRGLLSCPWWVPTLPRTRTLCARTPAVRMGYGRLPEGPHCQGSTTNVNNETNLGSSNGQPTLRED